MRFGWNPVSQQTRTPPLATHLDACDDGGDENVDAGALGLATEGNGLRSSLLGIQQLQTQINAKSRRYPVEGFDRGKGLALLLKWPVHPWIELGSRSYVNTSFGIRGELGRVGRGLSAGGAGPGRRSRQAGLDPGKMGAIAREFQRDLMVGEQPEPPAAAAPDQAVTNA